MQQSLTGATIGSGYRMDGELSGGNMGMVYVGTQLSVDRRVAIKVIDQERALNKRSVDRFFHEARIISKLEHPHIVRLYDFGRDERFDLLYLVMEFIQGPTLSDLLRTHRFSQPLVLELGLQICRALIESHAQNVVHRDLKPANILLSRMSDGSVQLKVVDFGVARALETLDKQLTAEGAICGTPRYMPPEQARHGAQIDGRADLYALGLILYEMLCGYPPFDAEDAIELIFKHLKEEPRALSSFLPPDLLHPELERLVHDLLKKSPAERPSDALAVLERLERLRHLVPHATESIRLVGRDTIYEELLPWMAPAVQEARAALVYGNTSQIGSEELELDPLETEWDHSHTVKFNINDLKGLAPSSPAHGHAPHNREDTHALEPANSEPFEEIATQIVSTTQLPAMGLAPPVARVAERVEHRPSREEISALETLDPAELTTLLDEHTTPALNSPAAPAPAAMSSPHQAFPQGKPMPPRVKLPKKNKTLSDTMQSFFLRISGRARVVTGVAENTAEDMFLNENGETLAALEEERAYLQAQRSRRGGLLVALIMASLLVLVVVLGYAFYDAGDAKDAPDPDTQSASELSAAQGQRPSLSPPSSSGSVASAPNAEEVVESHPPLEEEQDRVMVEPDMSLDQGALKEDAPDEVRDPPAVLQQEKRDDGQDNGQSAGESRRSPKKSRKRVSRPGNTRSREQPTEPKREKNDDLRWLEDI